MNARVFFAVLILFGCAHGVVVVNSLDWRDVVSGVYYAHATGDTVEFVAPAGDPATTVGKIGSGNSVFLIESKSNPVYAGLDVLLINNGNSVEVYKSEDPYRTNTELAKKSGAKHFILASPSYGYPAVSVLAYAKLKNAYLLFAERGNFGPVKDVLKDAESILVYGQVDEEVGSWLEGTGKEYEKINTGDKYSDNVELAKRYFSLNPSKNQAVLTDGSFLEDTIVAGDDPVIFIAALIPDGTYEYMKGEVESGRLSTGIVIGEDYALVAYSLKKRINNELGGENFSVLVKMSRKIPGIEGVLPLNTFAIPGPVVSVSIKEANYNNNTKAVEVVYANDGNAPGYFKSSSFVYVGGKYLATIGDSEPVSIRPGEEKGVRYGLEIPAGMDGDVVLNSTIIHGASPETFDSGFNAAFNASRVGYEDASSLLIDEASYDPAKNELVVRIRNAGPADGYFLFSVEYSEGGEKKIIEEEEVYELGGGESGFVKISNFIIEAPGSAEMKAKIKYGARAAFLEKTAEKEVAVAGIGEIPLWAVVLVVIVIVGIGYSLWKRRGRRRSIREEEKPLYRRIGLGM